MAQLQNFRFFFKSDEGHKGYELFEGRTEEEARQKARRFFNNKYDGFEITRVQPMTVKQGDDEVEEIPDEAKGGGGESPEVDDEIVETSNVFDIEPGGGGGKPPADDAKDWDLLFQQLKDDFKQLRQEDEERHQRRMDEQSNSFNKRMDDAVKVYTDQIKNLEGAKEEGVLPFSGFGDTFFQDQDAAHREAVDALTDTQKRGLLFMQSPLASFRQGMTAGLGGVPQNYLAKNYLERFMNPARVAHTIGSAMQGEEPVDFQGFVQNLFTGGDPRAQLGKMLGTGLEQLAGTGRAELAGMDPAQRRVFEGLTRPDITQEGGRANIEDVLNLAYGTQAQRFSPLVLQQMRRGLPSQDELWSDFQTQAMAGGGDPNFARFVQQQFGL